MAKPKEQDGRAVVVTTAHRGVFFGYLLGNPPPFAGFLLASGPERLPLSGRQGGGRGRTFEERQ